jgi:hypothetical protein
MLERREYLRCLKIFNEAVRESHPDLVLEEEELFKLANKATFGPPSMLTSETLLTALIRYAFTRPSIVKTPELDLPVINPSLAKARRGQCRYVVRRFRVGQATLSPEEYFLGPDISGDLLTITRTQEPVHFTTDQLFNTFIRLNLRWTLRDAIGRCTGRLSDTEVDTWKSDRRRTRRGRWLSLYPSRGDPKKIIHFIETYGPGFLRYPPRAAPPSSEWIDRVNAIPGSPWQFMAGPYPGSLLTILEAPHPLRRRGLRQITDFREALEHPTDPFSEDSLLGHVAARQWAADGWDFLSKFNYQYQLFTRVLRRFLDQPAPSPPRDAGTSYPHRTQDTLRILNHGLKGVNLYVSQARDGAVVTSAHTQSGLQSYYALLWETLPRHQRALQRCAWSTCRRPFIPQRRDQTCCSPQCARALRVHRHRSKRSRP